jgi:hypothetical protein
MLTQFHPRERRSYSFGVLSFPLGLIISTDERRRLSTFQLSGNKERPLIKDKAMDAQTLVIRRKIRLLALCLLGGLLLCVAASCTSESQNKMGRAVQNWTGTNGVLEIYAGGKLVQRFLKINKLSTIVDTAAPFGGAVRYGYGYVDENLNFTVDPGERKSYFEVSARANFSVFFENYKE